MRGLTTALDRGALLIDTSTIGAKVLKGQRNRFRALKNIRRTAIPGKGYRSYQGGGD